MTLRKIIFTRPPSLDEPDGGLSVVTPVINTDESISEAEAEQRAWDRLPADCINPQYVDASEILADRTFRDAWKASGKVIEVDMPKAREIHRNVLRRRGVADDPAIEAATTIEELKAVRPAADMKG